MNNTSRFKFYGILTALILVIAGAVWFYPRKEHSSKVPHAKKDGTPQQANRSPQQRSPQQPVASSTQQSEMDDVQKLSTKGWGPLAAHAMGIDIPIDEQRKMALTPDQEKQLEVPLKAIKSNALKMLAGNASYQQADDNTIIISTRLSQEESDEIEKRLYNEVGGIIGNDKLQFMDNILINGLRGACYAWGTGEMQFTVIGANRYNMATDKQTEEPLKTAEAFRVKFDFTLPGGINYGWTYRCTSKDSFIKEYGALAVATLQLATGEGN